MVPIFMQIREYLSQNYKLPEAVLEELISVGIRKVFAKNELILRPFKRSQKIYFVEKGLLKMYYDKEVRAITHSFITENQFIARSDVFLETTTQRNRQYGLKALEDQTTVYELPFSKIKFCAKSSMEINQLIQAILLHHLRNFSNRLSNLQFENAQERYQQLLEEQPEIVLRAPLGDIASYLGISQQTLSVIRAKIK